MLLMLGVVSSVMMLYDADMLLMRKIRAFFGPAQAILACVFWSVLESSLKSMLVFSPNHTITYYIHIHFFKGHGRGAAGS